MASTREPSLLKQKNSNQGWVGIISVWYNISKKERLKREEIESNRKQPKNGSNIRDSLRQKE